MLSSIGTTGAPAPPRFTGSGPTSRVIGKLLACLIELSSCDYCACAACNGSVAKARWESPCCGRRVRSQPGRREVASRRSTSSSFSLMTAAAALELGTVDRGVTNAIACYVKTSLRRNYVQLPHTHKFFVGDDMGIIAFDEIHGESWTISRDLAIRSSPSKPEYAYYGHLADVLRMEPQYKVVRLTQPWTDETLRGINVLIIAHPAHPRHEGVTCQGSPIFSAQDVKRINNFLQSGGGLFIFNEHEAERWGNNLNDLLAPYGIHCNGDTVWVQKGAEDAHVLVQHFVCEEVKDHPICDGIARVSFHRGCSINCDGEAEALIRAPGGQCVFAASDCGAGRVAVIGDTDLFSIPYVGEFDNLHLFQNAVQWLADAHRVGDKYLALQVIRRQAYDLSGVEHNRDLTQVGGNHVLEAGNSKEVFSLVSAFATDIDPYAAPEEFLDEAELTFHQLPRDIRLTVSVAK